MFPYVEKVRVDLLVSLSVGDKIERERNDSISSVHINSTQPTFKKYSYLCLYFCMYDYLYLREFPVLNPFILSMNTLCSVATIIYLYSWYEKLL